MTLFARPTLSTGGFGVANQGRPPAFADACIERFSATTARRLAIARNARNPTTQ
jgi:hypothetical protein